LYVQFGVEVETMSTATQRKEERIAIRATRAQVDLIDQAAETLQKSRTDYMLDVAYEASQRILADQRLFMLDDSERDEFLALLKRPPRAIPELRALFERGSVLGQPTSSARAEPLAG
jgi:uncharacterized protein (DUF1778 family)